VEGRNVYLEAYSARGFRQSDIETIEEVVRDSRLVDKGIRELKKLSANAPSFDPERRRFLKHVAVLAGFMFLGNC